MKKIECTTHEFIVNIPADIDDPQERIRIAFLEAENQSNVYALPCLWEIISDDGETVKVHHTFKTPRPEHTPCLCGARRGESHLPECPYPLYIRDINQDEMIDWETERNRIRIEIMEPFKKGSHETQSTP